MLEISIVFLLTTLKLLINIINKNKVNGRDNNKLKNLPTFSTLKKLIKAEYLIFDLEKNFNLLQNTFI